MTGTNRLNFYLSASSSDLDLVRSVMRRFEGLGLVNSLDWTKSFGRVLSSEDEQSIITEDLYWAVRADLFVFLDTPIVSMGAMMEYGARLCAGYVHHIGVGSGCCPGYLFFKSYKVKHHANVDEFISWIQGSDML